MSKEIETSENKDINFEEKINCAKELLEKLANQDITLSESMSIYKDGIKQIEEAQKLLDDAKLQFEELSS